MNVSVRSLPLLPFALACLISLQAARAQTSVSTNPVGYVQLTCSANTDTVVSVPFQQPASYVGLTATTSGSVITVAGTTGWTANQFVYSGSGTPTYYAQLGPATSGTDPKDGSFYTITANGTNTLTVYLNGDTISSVPAGSTVSVIPYWTITTVFPNSALGTSFVSSNSPTSRATQILLPSYSGTGINLAPSSPYYFYGGQWCLTGSSPSVSFNDTILVPNSYFIVRNSGSATTLTTMGNVLTGNLMIPLVTNTNIAQDDYVAICRPVATTLNNLGLIASGAFTPSGSPTSRKDQLLVWSGSETGVNQAPDLTYYYYVGSSGTGWRLTSDSLSNDHGNDTIAAGSGAIIRKFQTTSGTTSFWQNPAAY